MNSDNITDLLHQGFRVTLGVTVSLVETLQDSQKRTASLYQIAAQLSQLANEWAAKGEITEQEARNFIENLWQQVGVQNPNAATNATDIVNPTPTSMPPHVQDLQELTAQIAAIRAELARLRNSEGNNP